MNDDTSNDSEKGSVDNPYFSEEELQVCLKVLNVIGKNTNILESSSMRPLRKALVPLSNYLENKKYLGKGRKKYLEDKQLKAEQKARILKRQTMDRKHINSASLRRQRMKKLEDLLKMSSTNVPLISDGAADIEETKLLESSEYSVEVHNARSCYVCKSRFHKLHHFYDQLCPCCAELNFTKRLQSANLEGKVALVTGARVKIGYQIALKLLMSGAEVMATTRFPKDAAERFSQHPSYQNFKDRLHIFGIDFRDLVHVEQFTEFVMAKYPQLHIIIHNACQTIRRPPSYFAHLMKKEECASITSIPSAYQCLLTDQEQFHNSLHENKSFSLQPVSSGLLPSAAKSQIPMIVSDYSHDKNEFPEGMTDVNGQQIDLRRTNSWLLKLGDVSTPEVAEVFAINTLTPFTINNKLLPLMKKSLGKKFVVNVSAMEGKFYRYKTPNHPHTNMAKAALNMMTRTCAEDLSKNNIFMNSVDTGWINDENPLEKAHAHAKETNFQTPIDEIDAAARVLDPVFTGFNEDTSSFGQFYKDYRPTEW